MPWVEIFAVLVLCHLTGDYLLQTEWQAVNKRGGLGASPVSRRALGSHVTTYTLAFVPALLWLAGSNGAAVIGFAALIAIPHLVLDDGRLMLAYIRTVKGPAAAEVEPVVTAVDQTLHLIALFLVALLAAS